MLKFFYVLVVPIIFLCQSYVEKLTEDELRRHLLKVLTTGRATQEFLEAQEYRDGQDRDPEHQQGPWPSWCHCGWCRPMPTKKEEVCRGSRPCRQDSAFPGIVTSRPVLECVARRKLNLRGREIPAVIPNNNLRTTEYRQYIAWRRQGKGNPCLISFPATNFGLLGIASTLLIGDTIILARGIVVSHHHA